MLIRITVANRGPEAATLHLLPTLWYPQHLGLGLQARRVLAQACASRRPDDRRCAGRRTASFGNVRLVAGPRSRRAARRSWLVHRERDEHRARCSARPNADAVRQGCIPRVRDPRRARGGEPGADRHQGGRALYRLEIPAGARGRACDCAWRPSDDAAATRLRRRIRSGVRATGSREADEFYATGCRQALTADERRVARQAYAGLLWRSNFITTSVGDWLEGDPAQPAAAGARRATAATRDWRTSTIATSSRCRTSGNTHGIAAWDLAFHMIPFARIDPDFAKRATVLLPARMVHASERPVARLRVRLRRRESARSRLGVLAGLQDDRRTRRSAIAQFLARAFQKLLLNFTWWVNRKDPDGNNLFAGGFLGLDNIGVFDRSQAAARRRTPRTSRRHGMDGVLLRHHAVHGARTGPRESGLRRHGVEVLRALRRHRRRDEHAQGGNGLWDEQDGFYYDQLELDGADNPAQGPLAGRR